MTKGTFWCKSEKHPTILDYMIERDVDEVFAKISAPEDGYFHHCHVCKETTVWKRSTALVNAFQWGADFAGDKPGRSFSAADAPHGVTMHRQSGVAKLIEVVKCSVCGRSLSAGVHEVKF